MSMGIYTFVAHKSLEEKRREWADRPEHLPEYPARSFEDHTAREASAASCVTHSHPIPWPAHFDPPAFPHEPGQHPDKLRDHWRAWMQGWDVISDPLFGDDPEHELVGDLFMLLAHLVHAGVRFDPEFQRAMATWAWSGYQVDVDWSAWDQL